MVLTEFIKRKDVKEKFKTEFNPAFDDNPQPSSYKKTSNGDIVPKQNIGIYFEISDSDEKWIFDSNGRKKVIFSIGGILNFLNYEKYGNQICWFYDAFNFKSIMNYLPEEQLKDLETSHKTECNTFKIEQKGPNFFQIINKSNKSYKFYNLFPHYTSSLDEAAIKYLNYQRPELNTFDNRCLEKAKLIQRLACYSKDNNIYQDYITHKKVVNEPKIRNHGNLIGTAFHYLLPFFIKAHNPRAITHSLCVGYNPDDFDFRKKQKIESIIKNARKHYDNFLKEREINDDLIISSLLLAKIEAFVYWDSWWENINWDVDNADFREDVDDLRNLIMGVPKSLYNPKNHCFLKPRFGLASNLVNGAEADLFIDNTLIDVKTTNKPNFTPKFFNQLMGYVILHDLGRVYQENIKQLVPKGRLKEINWDDLDKEFLNTKIEKIGIYFARFNYLDVRDLKDVLPEGRINEDMLKWFENEAHKEYEPRILENMKLKKFFYV